jgi:hypothetical protein
VWTHRAICYPGTDLAGVKLPPQSKIDIKKSTGLVAVVLWAGLQQERGGGGGPRNWTPEVPPSDLREWRSKTEKGASFLFILTGFDVFTKT